VSQRSFSLPSILSHLALVPENPRHELIVWGVVVKALELLAELLTIPAGREPEKSEVEERGKMGGGKVRLGLG
jgi:hypothetical protein